MAKEADVSARTIVQAKKVEESGSKELKEAVHKGDVPVKRAAEIAKLPKKDQAKALRAAPAQKPKHEPHPIEKAYAELRETNEELAGELQSCEAIRNGKEAQEMKTLREQLRVACRRRDELMTQVDEMRKQIAYWKRKAEKSGAA
jgi:hypothetical protein